MRAVQDSMDVLNGKWKIAIAIAKRDGPSNAKDDHYQSERVGNRTLEEGYRALSSA